jgi:hypothetical protein
MSRPQRPARARTVAAPAEIEPKVYRHKQEAVARPEVGAAPRFRAKREKATYRYDSSLSPALDWDANPSREIAGWLLAAIQDAAPLPGQAFPEPRVLRGADGKPLLTVAGLQDALALLKRMQVPSLNWTGKAERLSFDVPTLPLFVHERLSTEAIIRTLEGHRKAAPQTDMFDLFADPKMPMAQQVNAYAHRGAWVNRMVLGESRRDELPAALRGPRGTGPDDLHGPAVRGEVRLELPALRAQGRSEAWRRRGHLPRAGDGASVPGHVGVGVALLPDLSPRPPLGGEGLAHAERQRVRADR